MGTLKNMPAHELGSMVIKAALHQVRIDPEMVSEVIMGQVNNL